MAKTINFIEDDGSPRPDSEFYHLLIDRKSGKTTITFQGKEGEFVDGKFKPFIVGSISNAESLPYAKYDASFVEPTAPFPGAEHIANKGEQ